MDVAADSLTLKPVARGIARLRPPAPPSLCVRARSEPQHDLRAPTRRHAQHCYKLWIHDAMKDWCDTLRLLIAYCVQHSVLEFPYMKTLCCSIPAWMVQFRLPPK